MRPKILLLVSLILLMSLVRFSRLSVAAELANEGNLEGRVTLIEREREEKDRFFREAPSSPLTLRDQRGFQGLRYYPIDLRYLFSGRIERYPEAKRAYVKLPTNKGNFRTYIKEGIFRFRIDGIEFGLTVYRFLGRSRLFLPFRDKTNGEETYTYGRYVDVEVTSDNEIVVDFNRAHNPFCAYNPKYTCAYASEENILSVPIPCGEKNFSRSR
ncbi:MAG: DUF1684 domain-containing protein [Proteobacteria bacterium]|nr:DUF1684 domain-containing protein [Pseudomonadota bacterium]